MPIADQARGTAAAPVRCPVCHQELPPHLPPSRCPHCLLRQALPSDLPDAAETTADAPAPAASQVRPQPGEAFGHYRIGRPLGDGGMGAVFEAEDLDSGRRVALKVLGHRLDSPESRHRFFREGRLAASVNHPNSVYVFGTEEIAGVPVIAMELVAGGTLQDRVLRDGPLQVGAAVDSVLQIIAGLEAAQRVGVLHRDVKPSNCFVEADGTVKIGDFGLSISTFVRTEPALTSAGAFLGTPAFSSPEQLRGDELTVRSDIYAVGVTLYYLLTGHHPFEAPDLVRMLATVLERRADSPAKWRAGLPGLLCRIVLRCLEKDPERRFRNYAELRDALLPFGSAAPTPATLNLRLLAWLADGLLLALPSIGIQTLIQGAEDVKLPTLDQALLSRFWVAMLALAYFGGFEGLCGASPGKFICSLRVVRVDRTAPGVLRALWRAFLVTTLPASAWLAGRVMGDGWTSPFSWASWMTAVSLLTLGMRGLLFVTARRQNGYAGLHDLASGTRVIVRPAYRPRPALELADEGLPQTEARPRIGPYHVLDRVGSDEGVGLLLGFDPRLLRRVWIHRWPVGSPPVAVGLRGLNRPGRLRWLAGKRTDTEAWDAYEAATGHSLLAVGTSPQPWSRVRFWLLDLAEELQAASLDGSLPTTLSLDRIWITADGRAKLLDFVAPGTSGPSSDETGHAPMASAGRPTSVAQGCAEPVAPAAPPSPLEFLRHVAVTALEGRLATQRGPGVGLVRVPLAVRASRFLETLRGNADLTERLSELRSLLGLVGEVSRARRAALLAGALAFPLIATLVGGQLHLYRDAVERGMKRSAERFALAWYLDRHREIERPASMGDPAARTELAALETFLAGRFAPLLTNAAPTAAGSSGKPATDPLAADLARILPQRVAPSPERFVEATAAVERRFGRPPEAVTTPRDSEPTLPATAVLVVFMNTVIFVIIPCLIGSLLFRTGALARLLGIALVNRTGALASRWRVTARNLAAWLPFLLIPLLARLLTPALGRDLGLVVTASFVAGLALVSLVLPGRGLADRLAGTWLVPR